jgi:hypothetical protein
VFGSIAVMGKPIISLNTWHISYFVNLSSEENWRILGSVDRSGVLRYFSAMSKQILAVLKLEAIEALLQALLQAQFGKELPPSPTGC